MVTPTDVGISPDDPWFGYVKTVVELVRPALPDLAVRAMPLGTTGIWPWATRSAVFVLTAWDPGDERLSEEVNQARQAALDAELRPRAKAWWRTRGFDQISGYRDAGVAVSGLDERLVLEAGARFGQDAVFAWSPDEWAIISCSGDRRLSLGWAVAEVHHRQGRSG